MKKYSIFNIILLAALTFMWGCGSDDEDPDSPEPPEPKEGLTWLKTEGTPDWKIDWTGDDAAPNWTEPDPGKYETWMILMVRLEPELAKYSTEEDLMAAFIGDELRALSRPSVVKGDANGEVAFILKVYGNEVSDKAYQMRLSYYSSQLHRLFTLTGNQTFIAEFVYGDSEPYMPSLLAACDKYPQQLSLTFQLPMKAQEVVHPAAGDIVAAMVGNECRGLVSIGQELFAVPYSLTVYGREGETANLYYYNASEKAVWIMNESIKISNGSQLLNVDP